MEKDVIHYIGTFGLTHVERRILTHLFALRGKRAWHYELVDADDQTLVAPINLVDLDDVEATARWREFRARYAQAVPVYVTSSPDAHDGEYLFSRPLRTQHLLQDLDNIVVNKLQLVPAIAENAVDNSQICNLAVADPDQRNAQFKALVVDDSPTVGCLMQLSLSNLNIASHIIETGNEALKHLNEAHPYDIAFLDVVLPGVDGYRLCKKIKSDRRTRHMPVIMLTGKHSPVDRVRGKMAGSNAYLTKPLEQSELKAVIRKYLRAVKTQ